MPERQNLDPIYAMTENPFVSPTSNIVGRTQGETQLIQGLRLQLRAHMKQERPQYAGPRVAPLHPLQIQAEQEAQKAFQRQQQTDTFKLMRQEIDQSRKRDIFRVAQPYLDKASTEPDQYIQKYMSKLMPYIKDMADQRREEFEKYTFPKIGAHFMGNNAYHTGAREKAERRAREEFERNEAREQNRLALEGYSAGHEHHHKTSGRFAENAKIARDTVGQQKEHGIVAANALRNAEAAQMEQEKQGAEQLGQVGWRRQEQEQREHNERRKKHEEAMDAPLKDMQFESNILGNHAGPIGVSTFSAAAAPPAPNWTSTAAEALRAVPGIAAAQRRSGGRIGHYADGGHVLPPSYADSQLPGFNTPEMNSMRQTAAELGHTHPHNAAISMAIGAGASAAARAGARSPWGSWGHGIKTEFENLQNVEQARYMNKERGANLMAKIQESRLDQHKVLNEYAQKQRDFQETKRLHNAQIEHYDAQNKELEARYRMGGENSSESLPTKKMTPAREKAITEADAGIDNAISLIKQARATRKSLGKIETNPLVGGVAEFPGLKQIGLGSHAAALIPGAGSPEDISNAGAMSNEYLTTLRDLGEKAGRSIPELRLRQEGKPGLGRFNSYNVFHTEKSEEGGQKLLQQHLRKMEFSGASPAMIKATRERIEEALKEEEEEDSLSKGESSKSSSIDGAEDDKIAALKAAIAAKKKELDHE